MTAQYVFALTIGFFALFLVFVARFNIRNQKAFLARTLENADKMAAQRAATQEMIAQQTAVLERIAVALERGKA